MTQTLYATKGGSAASDLYTVDPLTAAQSSVGPTGHAITGLAFDPTSGILYGATTNGSPLNPGSLVTIDPSTGVTTLVAAFTTPSGNAIPDIAFDAGGQLYGWLERPDEGLATIDKATGVVTALGASPGFNTYGDGFDIFAGTGYGFPGGGNSTSFPGAPYGLVYTFNPATGVLVAGATITGGAVTDGPSVAAVAADAGGVLYVVLNDFPATSLATIDPATGVTTDIGALANGFDGLAWSPGVAAPAITLTPTSGIVGASVSVDGTGFAPGASLTATFNGAPLTIGGTTTTDGSGDFSGATFVVPAVSPGVYPVVFDDGATSSAPRPFAVTFSAPAVLYGAQGAGISSDLYTIDPATGATTSVGPTGYSLTGLAQHPILGDMYAVSGTADPVHPRSLFSVDLGTGAATLIGALGTGKQVGDIAFDSAGNLYGFGTRAPRYLYKINLSTGAATRVGSAAGTGGFGMGLTANASDVLDLFSGGDTGDYYTVNRLTGVPTDSGIPLSGGPFGDGAAVAAASWPQNFATVYAVLNDFPASHLVTIDVVSGSISDIGPLPSSFDALAWTGQGGPAPPPITAVLIFDSAPAFRLEP